ARIRRIASSPRLAIRSLAGCISTSLRSIELSVVPHIRRFILSFATTRKKRHPWQLGCRSRRHTVAANERINRLSFCGTQIRILYSDKPIYRFDCSDRKRHGWRARAYRDVFTACRRKRIGRAAESGCVLPSCDYYQTINEKLPTREVVSRVGSSFMALLAVAIGGDDIDTGQRLGITFLALAIHAPQDLDTLRLRRTGAMHRLGQIANRVATQRHVLDQTQHTH